MAYQLWKFTILISLFLIFSQCIGAAEDAEPSYQYFQILTQAEPVIPSTNRDSRFRQELVESPFFLEIQTETINKKVYELRSSPEGSLENFIFQYFTALGRDDRGFLKDHMILENDKAFGISIEHLRKTLSINALMKTCHFIGDAVLVTFESAQSKKLHYSFFHINNTYKLSWVDNVGNVSGLLEKLKPISKEQVSKLKNKVEISLKDQMPVKNKAYLYFDAKPIDQKVNKDSPNQNEFVDRPKWLLYQDLVRAVEKVDRAKIKEITLPMTYNSFLDEFQWNVGNGFQIYLRPLLETKHFRLEVENEQLAFYFFQNQSISENYPYEIFMLRKIGPDWKITNFHGGSILEQLLLEPAMQKQVVQLFK